MEAVPRGRSTVVRLLAAGLLLLLLVGHDGSAAAQDSGLVVEGTTTYLLDVEAEVVRVTAELRLTNTLPARTIPGPSPGAVTIETPYFEAFGIPVQGPVDDLQARSGNRDLTVRLDDLGDGASMATVTLSPHLVHGSPQDITITFDLPSQPSRSESLTRINEAYASWFVFDATAPGDGAVVIDIPERFTMELGTGPDPDVTTADGRSVHRIERTRADAPAAFVVSVRDDDRLRERSLEAGDVAVTLRYWPGDDDWAAFVAGLIEDGIQVLEDVIGREIGVDKLTVVESSGGLHRGYAGFYVPALRTIEVSDRFDERTLLHELSHVWINHALFDSLWIIEGLAEAVAHLALADMGLPDHPADAIDRTDPGALALNDWHGLDPADPLRPAIEAFAYNASRVVMDALVDDIGRDGLRAVLLAALDGRIAWRAPSVDAESHPGERDWTWFLDLAELVGGSTTIRAAIDQHVATDADMDRLADRDRTLLRHDALIEAVRPWGAPLAVRQMLARWEFDRAGTAIDDALAIHRRIEELQNRSVPGVDARALLQDPWERADDLAELDGLVTAVGRVVEGLDELDRRRDALGPLATIGLLGAPSREAVVDALGQGDVDAAATALEAAAAALDQASARGAALTAAVVLVLVVATVRLRRRGRQGRDQVSSPPPRRG